MDLHPMLLLSCFRAFCFSMVVTLLSLTWPPAMTLATPLTKCPSGILSVSFGHVMEAMPASYERITRAQRGTGPNSSCLFKYHTFIGSLLFVYDSDDAWVANKTASVFYQNQVYVSGGSGVSLFLRCFSAKECKNFMTEPLEAITANFSSTADQDQGAIDEMREQLEDLSKRVEILKRQGLLYPPMTLPEDPEFIKELEVKFDEPTKLPPAAAPPKPNCPKPPAAKEQKCNCPPVCPRRSLLPYKDSVCKCQCGWLLPRVSAPASGSAIQAFPLVLGIVFAY